MLRRTASLIRKEMLHIVRDPRTLVIMIALPLFLLVVLGYAATTDVDHLRTAVYDADKSPQSRALIRAYQNSNYFDIVAYVEREADLTFLIDHGDARGALVIPTGYGQAMLAGKHTNVAFVIDGSDPSVANTAFAASQAVGRDVTFKSLQQRAGALVSSLPGLEVRPRVWYNPNLESAYYMIPGLLVLVIFLFTTLFTSTSIVRERELGTIEQLIVTPIRPIELIVAKVFPYVLVSVLVVIELLVAGRLMFNIPINGSLSLLLGLSALFIVAALGIGIFISSVAKVQVEAFLLTFATVLPAIFLGGLYFPIEAMPPWLQAITYVIPVRYGLVIVRSIMLKGVGLEMLTEQVMAMLVFCVIIVTLAAVRFKKKLD